MSSQASKLISSDVITLFSTFDLKRSRFKWPVWPDLAQFLHLGKNLKVFGHFQSNYLVFGKIVNPVNFWAFFHDSKGPNIENII